MEALFKGVIGRFAGPTSTLVVPSDDCSADLTANWTDVNGALTHAGSEYTYTVTTGANVATFTDEATLTVGKKYRATVLAKNGTGVGSTVRINALTNADVVIENGTSITVAAGFAIATVEWIATEINNKVQIEIVAGTVGNGETVIFDTITTRAFPDFNTDIGARMYLAECPQGTVYPNATYQLVHNTNDWTFTDDFDNSLIQFNLYSMSNSAAEITDAEHKLRLLYDNCSLATTDLGSTWGHVLMQRDGSWLDKIPHPDSTGGGNIWRYVVEYRVMLTKGSNV